MQKKLEAIKAQVLGPYQVRKSAAQKEAFARWACEYAQDAGFEATVEESGKWLKTRNIVFGDLKKATVLITAHYDTCARLPFGNTYTPDCWPFIIATQFILPVAAYVLLCVWLGIAAGTAVCAAVVLLMLFGPENPHTANDNTSGVAFVLLALHAFKARRDVAFVLFDNEEVGLLGSSAFLRAHTALSNRALVLNFDCVSDGDTLLFAGSRAAMKSVKAKRIAAALEEIAPAFGKQGKCGEAPKVLYPSDQLLFRRGAAFAWLKGERILYMDRIHSAKDTVFEDANLLCLMQVLLEAL